MKFGKILAAFAAAAVAVSAMAVNSFALSTKNYLKDGTVFINADKPEDPTWAKDAGVAQTDVYGVTYHVTFNADEVKNEATWIGGGIGANSKSTGWKQIEWGRSGKEITADLTNGTITWLSDKPVFTADDAYAQFWIQTWGGTVTVNSADVLGKGGALLSDDNDVVAVAETTAVTEAATEEEAAEEAVAEPEDTDEEITDEEITDEPEEIVDEPEEITEDTTDDVTVIEEAPAVDTTTAPAATGNTAAAVIVSVMAVAGLAAIAAKKRK